jgi:hypothetical protein
MCSQLFSKGTKSKFMRLSQWGVRVSLWLLNQMPNSHEAWCACYSIGSHNVSAVFHLPQSVVTVCRVRVNLRCNFRSEEAQTNSYATIRREPVERFLSLLWVDLRLYSGFIVEAMKHKILNTDILHQQLVTNWFQVCCFSFLVLRRFKCNHINNSKLRIINYTLNSFFSVTEQCSWFTFVISDQ